MSANHPLGATATEEPVYSVAELTAEIKDLLETAYPRIWVSGEISNLSRPRSGHCYLTLKDEEAQLPAVLWRSTASRVKFDLRDGLEVVCRGRIDLYPPRGRYQMIVEEIQPRGIGALELAFRRLHERLAAEGLFDPARKVSLPRFAKRVAVVTSPTGAAIRDFLQVLRRRSPNLDVWIVPVRVQGEGSAEEIADAIAMVNRLAEPVDCLVVTRGGGSLEDLWSFNEEIVVRAIAASRVPVISAVGHEVDVTLSDLAADVRALTPSEAAERVAPAGEELAGMLHQYRGRLAAALRAKAVTARARLEALEASAVFRRPLDRLHHLASGLDDLENRADRAVRTRCEAARSRIESLAGRLEALSPLAVLARGYSLTQDAEGRLIRAAQDVEPGQAIRTRLGVGELRSRVEEVRPETKS